MRFYQKLGLLELILGQEQLGQKCIIFKFGIANIIKTFTIYFKYAVLCGFMSEYKEQRCFQSEKLFRTNKTEEYHMTYNNM